MKRTFKECLAMFNHCPPPERWANAVLVRCKFECLTDDEIEARIARWEALEASEKELNDWLEANPDSTDPLIVEAALRAKVAAAHPLRTGADVLSRPAASKTLDQWLGECLPPTFAKHAAAQALQPTINAELAAAITKAGDFVTCQGCGGVGHAGHHCVTCDTTSSGPAECGCGGPAGHVPNGLLCRKGMR